MIDGTDIQNRSTWNFLPNPKDTQQQGSFLGLAVKQDDTSRKTTIKNEIIDLCKKIKEYTIYILADTAVFLVNTLERVYSSISNLLFHNKYEIKSKPIPRIAEHRLKQNLEFKEKIGSGRTADVFSGVFKGEDVVIKQISKEGTKYTGKITKELIYLAAKVEVTNLFWVQKNPHFVTIITAYQDKDNYYIIMKNEGSCFTQVLFDSLKKDQPTDTIKKMGCVIVDLSVCLKALLSAHVCYRDFKCNNLVYTDSNVKICDLGFSAYNGAYVVLNPNTNLIRQDIDKYEHCIRNIFTSLLNYGYEYDTSILLKEYTEEKRQEIFENYLKPELDKNNLITDKHMQVIKQTLNDRIKTTQSFIQDFLGTAFNKLNWKCLFDEASYDDVTFVMTSIIDGWQNFIKDELGYIKLTDNLGNADTK
jgi:serine/threonine protein kinase